MESLFISSTGSAPKKPAMLGPQSSRLNSFESLAFLCCFSLSFLPSSCHRLFEAASYMTSYDPPSQQDDGLHVWRPQPGLEFDSNQNGAKRSSRHDEQPAPSSHHSNGFHDDGKTSKTYPKKTSRNPFGLSPLLFGLLVALVTAIITGGAVGGGVGSQIKSSSE
jgi:hypothetical protein